MRREGMRERPILFSSRMVQAILEGRKTMTRRPVKPQVACHGWAFELHPFAPSTLIGTPAEGRKWGPEKKVWVVEDAWKNIIAIYGDCPYGQPGDWLWVKETWRPWNDPNLWDVVQYRADMAIIKPKITNENQGHRFHEDCESTINDQIDGLNSPWKPSIHMPRWASRILLEIINVRVDRIQDIAMTDAIAEGYAYGDHPNDRDGHPKHNFKLSWNATYPGSWDRNDWVWVIEFKRVENEA